MSLARSADVHLTSHQPFDLRLVDLTDDRLHERLSFIPVRTHDGIMPPRSSRNARLPAPAQLRECRSGSYGASAPPQSSIAKRDSGLSLSRTSPITMASHNSPVLRR